MANITFEPLIISHRTDGLASVGRRLVQWRQRSRERAELAQIDSRGLRDIGLTPAEAAYEINKPFWRP